MTADTVPLETPARLATSSMVIFFMAALPFQLKNALR
jgi:hypothetical protein